MAAMMRRMRSILIPFRFLASPIGMFFALPWLMLLLVMGTVAQRYLGLYESQKLFFGSFVLWVGSIPLPGAYSTLAFVALSLIAKLLLKSPFSRAQAGTILIHVSAVVLLVGGLVSALTREEGYIVLDEDKAVQAVSDYQQRALEIMQGDTHIASKPYGSLRVGDVIAESGLPFRVKILKSCFPCAPAPRATISPDAHGIAGKLELTKAPFAKDEARNLTAVEFQVAGAGEADGTYIAFEGLEPATLNVGSAHYTFTLKPAARVLPFSVRLTRFIKSDYPGTEEASAYRSEVAIGGEGPEWSAVIEMNQPLRHKGYTLYQSSYVEEDGRQLSVLAVVKNAGEWFPYIAVSMLCVGLVLHLLIVLRGRTVL